MTSPFASVDADSDSPCGQALAKGERIFVEFTEGASEAADGSNRLHFEHGLLCAQSTPLLCRTG